LYIYNYLWVPEVGIYLIETKSKPTDLLISGSSKCPFHGFAKVKIRDSIEIIPGEDKTCGFFEPGSEKLKYSGDCPLAIRNGSSDWEGCPWNCQENKARIERTSGMKIFPMELHPEGAETWSGITVSEWFRHKGIDMRKNVK
jgi:hypothetical protein